MPLDWNVEKNEPESMEEYLIIKFKKGSPQKAVVPGAEHLKSKKY